MTQEPATEVTTKEAAAIETQQNNIQWIVDYLKSQVKVHGISFFLLGLAVWYFTGENREIKNEIRMCNEARMEQYQVERQQMMEVINNNTKALDKLN